MVARAGGYYGEAFKGARGVTQGDPLSPTIFNVVIDVVVRHWVAMALEEAEKKEERGNEGRHQAALLYAYDGMVAFSDPRCPSQFIRTGGPADQCREDGQHGLPAVPIGRNTIVSGVRAEDDGGGTDIPGVAEGTGRVRGIREGYGGRISGIP